MVECDAICVALVLGDPGPSIKKYPDNLFAKSCLGSQNCLLESTQSLSEFICYWLLSLSNFWEVIPKQQGRVPPGKKDIGIYVWFCSGAVRALRLASKLVFNGPSNMINSAHWFNAVLWRLDMVLIHPYLFGYICYQRNLLECKSILE